MPSLWDFADEEAQRQGVDPALVRAVMQQESGGKPGLVSSAGARGPMQLMPATARELGVNPDDPYDNIRGGVKYLGQMLTRFGGDPRLAAAAYNAGPGAVERAGGVPNYRETQNYVRSVVGDAPVAKLGEQGIKAEWLDALPEDPSKVEAVPAAAAGPAPISGLKADWLEGETKPTAAAPAAQQAASPQRSVMERITNAARDFQPVSFGGPGEPTAQVSPLMGGIAKGLVSPLTFADRLGQRVARAIPEQYGGNPNEPLMFADKVDNFIDQHTAKPQSAAGQALEKVGEYGGSGLSMGGAVRGLGRLLPGRVGQALVRAGAPTLGNVAGSITGGAAAEATDQLIGDKIANPYARTALDVAAGVVGGGLGASAGNRLQNGVTNAEQRAALDAAKQAGIPVQASDVSPRWQGFKTAVADKVPFGNLFTKGTPQRQVQGVRQELEATAGRYKPAGLDATAGAAGTDRFLAEDLRTQYRAAKQATNDAYGLVQRALDQNPNMPPIQLDAAKAQVKAIQEQFPKTFRDVTLSQKARQALGLIGKATKPANGGVVNVGGTPIDLDANPAMKAALEAAGALPKQPKVSLQEARDLSSELWDAARSAERSAFANGGSQKQAGALKALAQAVGGDVDTYMAQAPQEVQNAYRAADATFKARVLPFRADPKVYKLVSSKTPTEDFDLAAQGLYGNLFNTQQGERSAMALGLMSEKGRQAAAYQALKDAAAKGLSTASPTGLKVAAANRALDVDGNPALANIAAAYPALGSEAQRLQGLLQIGRTAANEVARHGAATGIQGVKGITGASQLMLAHQLAERLNNNMAGYGIVIGAPVAGANGFNLLNRYGARAVLADPGTLGQRVAPGAVQGLLASDEDER